MVGVRKYVCIVRGFDNLRYRLKTVETHQFANKLDIF